MSKTKGAAYVAGVVAACLAVARTAHAATDQNDTRLADADAPAAPAAEASVGGGLEEVIVTARKRSENIQDTPVSITALSSDDLANRRVIAVQDLAAVTPSLAIQQSPYDILGSFIGIRGQQQTDLVITQTPPVGIYVDGVYYPTSLGTSLNNFEGVSQIEVLKGPQGTLYGRNTTGGAIQITTQPPDYDGVSGTVKAGYGKYDERNVAGSVNIPLIQDRVALRLTGQFVKRNGTGNDLGNGVDLDDLENGTARAALRVDVTDRFHVMLRGEFSRAISTQNIEDLAYVAPGFSIAAASVATQIGALNPEDFNILGGLLTTGAPPAGATPQQLATFFADVNKGRAALASYICSYCRTVTYPTPASLVPFGLGGAAPVIPDTTANLNTYSATAQYDFSSNFYIKSITAYQYTQRTAIGNTNASPFLLIDGTSDSQNPHEVTQEVQIGGNNLDERLKWVGGYYFFHLHGYDNADPILELVPFLANPISNRDDFTDQSSSGYGQATYALTQNLNFTGGLRYTSERTRVINQTHDAASCSVEGVAPGSPCSATYYNSFNNTSYTAGFDMKLTQDLMAYVKTSSGFRAGGTNQRGAPLPFRPETVTDYEAGLKSELFDRRLRLNLAGYVSNYHDIQRSVNVTYLGQFVTAVQNAASARITGVELESTFLPVDALRITTSGAFTNAGYHKYVGQSPTGELVDLSHNKFPNLSRWQGDIAATYTVSEPIGTLSATADFSWRSAVDYVPDAHSLDSAAAVVQTGYGLLNARLAQNVTAWNLEIAFWGRNLADKKYAAGANDFSGNLGFAYTIPGIPRTFGIEVRKNF